MSRRWQSHAPASVWHGSSDNQTSCCLLRELSAGTRRRWAASLSKARKKARANCCGCTMFYPAKWSTAGSRIVFPFFVAYQTKRSRRSLQHISTIYGFRKCFILPCSNTIIPQMQNWVKRAVGKACSSNQVLQAGLTGRVWQRLVMLGWQVRTPANWREGQTGSFAMAFPNSNTSIPLICFFRYPSV